MQLLFRDSLHISCCNWQVFFFVCLATVRQPPMPSTWDTLRDSRLGTHKRSNSKWHRINMTCQHGSFLLCLNLTSALKLFLDKKEKKKTSKRWGHSVNMARAGPCVTGDLWPSSRLLFTVFEQRDEVSVKCSNPDHVWCSATFWLHHLRGSSPAPCLSPDCPRCSQCSSGGWRSRRRAFGSGPAVGRTAPTGRAASPASPCSTVDYEWHRSGIQSSPSNLKKLDS